MNVFSALDCSEKLSSQRLRESSEKNRRNWVASVFVVLYLISNGNPMEFPSIRERIFEMGTNIFFFKTEVKKNNMEKKTIGTNCSLCEEIDDDLFPNSEFYSEEWEKINLDRNNIIICGQSQSGKTLLLVNMLLKFWIWKVPANNIYIFSKTACIDLTYRPLI